MNKVTQFLFFALILCFEDVISQSVAVSTSGLTTVIKLAFAACWIYEYGAVVHGVVTGMGSSQR